MTPFQIAVERKNQKIINLFENFQKNGMIYTKESHRLFSKDFASIAKTFLIISDLKIQPKIPKSIFFLILNFIL